MDKVLIIDPMKCTGCRSCEAACSTWKEGETNIVKSRIRIVPFIDEAYFHPIVCQQCETPFCAIPCPTGALRKNTETGMVELYKGKCVGCRLCLMSCPFGAITVLEDSLASKCDLCDRDPMCVKFCEFGALTYGERDEISANKRAVVAEKVKKAYEEITFGE